MGNVGNGIFPDQLHLRKIHRELQESRTSLQLGISMKNFVVGTLALASAGLVAAPASSADLPARTYTKATAMVGPAYNWSGFYVGVNVGGEWSRSDVSTRLIDPGNYFGPADVTRVSAAGLGTLRRTSFTGGGQAGYNWQAGNLVAGIEADLDSFNFRASRTLTAQYQFFIPGFANFTINQAVASDWLFTARGRLGYAVNNWLFYGTGGLAAANINYTNSFTDLAGPAAETGSVSKTRVGWTAGVGGEVGLTPNWTIKVEYLYVDLGKVSSSVTSVGDLGIPPPIGCAGVAGDCTARFAHSASLQSNIVRIGLNYKFDGTAVSRN
jgi:outer membrane immunogenic protein